MCRIPYITVLLTAGWLFAADPKPEPDAEASQQPTLSETITVSAEAQAVTVKDATAKVSVISDKEIEKRMMNNMRDLIRYEPGVTVDNDPSRLGLSGFNIRGVGGNRVATVIDGVRGPEAFQFGPLAVHRFSMDLDMVERVEIVRSASSSLYGSDALGGLVSFKTKDPASLIPLGSKQSYRLKSDYDGRDRGARFGFTTAQRNGRFQWMAQASVRQFNETDSMGELESADRSRTAANPIDGTQTQMMLKGVWELGSHQVLRATLENYRNQVDSQVLSSQGQVEQFGALVDTQEFTADDSSNRLRASLAYEHLFESAFIDRLELRLNVQDSRTEQDTSEHRVTSGARGSNILRTGQMDFEQRVFGLNLRLDRTFATGFGEFQFLYGGSFERDQFEQIRDRADADFATGAGGQYRGTLIFPTRYFPPSDVNRLGAYVQMEGLFLDGRLKLIPGLRYDRHELKPDMNDTVYMTSVGVESKAMDVDQISPKMGVQYELNRYSAMSFQYAEGFRAPPFSAVNSGFSNLAGGYTSLANPNLDPETSENFEIGLKLYNTKGSLFLTWFDNRYEDFIENAFVGVNEMGLALFQSQNLGNVDISGIELAGDLSLGKGFRLRASYADIEGEDRGAELPLNRIPPQRLVLGVDWDHKRYQASLSATSVSAKQVGDVNDPNLFLPDDYTTVDLTAGLLFGGGFSARVGGFNLTDETYHPWSDVLGRRADDAAVDRFSAPGRTLSLALSYLF